MVIAFYLKIHTSIQHSVIPNFKQTCVDLIYYIGLRQVGMHLTKGAVLLPYYYCLYFYVKNFKSCYYKLLIYGKISHLQKQHSLM